MASGKRWTREELLIALNLYHKLRFGQFDRKQPVIIDLAKRLKRTSDSVAMKLSNLASLDPVLKLRGIKGLDGASDLDKELWSEFHENPAEMVPLSQKQFDSLFTESRDETTEVLPGTGIRCRKIPPAGETEYKALTKQRRGQDYFREIVLNNYGGRCGITGLPIRELLIASHILPWGSHEKERLNVRNGICLNRLHDAAFDQGLIGFDPQCRVIISAKLRSHFKQSAMDEYFEPHAGKILILPSDGILPQPDFLATHCKRFALC